MSQAFYNGFTGTLGIVAFAVLAIISLFIVKRVSEVISDSRLSDLDQGVLLMILWLVYIGTLVGAGNALRVWLAGAS